MSYAGLHQHFDTSCLDGMSKPETFLAKAAAMGMPAAAITDHGNLHGAVGFYTAAKKVGVKPIIGAELYVAPRGHLRKEGALDSKSFHLTVLARNLTGYKNLIHLVSIGHLEGMYYKQPRVDLEVLGEHADGLIALSGCCSSQLSAAILRGDRAAALGVAEHHREIFGPDNYYLEIQRHPFEDQRRVNGGLLELALKMALPLVATTDSHYTEPGDARAHDVLLCIQVGKDVNDPTRLKFNGDDYYLHTPEEMAALFSDLPEALENTLAIAERCDLEIPMGGWILPAFEPPDGSSAEEYLRRIVYEGMTRQYPEITQELVDRIEYELDVIISKGYAGYMLIVADYVNWAKAQGIAVGPGRGSAAGSVVSYLLNITGLDPLYFRLPFERFLTKERPSGPDIDLDFSDKRRDEVLAYVARKYGHDRVARICSFGTMGSRGAVRDVGRVLGMRYGDVDQVCKLMPADRGPGAGSVAEALEASKGLGELYRSAAQVKELVDLASSLEGTIRLVSTHACGVVIGDRPLVEYLPLMRESRESNDESGEEGVTLLTQFDYTTVEKIGLLKMDFLGLINLSMIEQSVRLIQETQGVSLDISTIPLDDPKTYALLSSGETTGIFQMESGGIRKWIQQLRPASIFDLAALTALYRPGPMNALPAFVERKNDPSKVTYLDPRLEPILSASYGVVTYQDDVLLIAVRLAGFSWGEADALRKAMGKKIAAEMESQRAKLLDGLVANGEAFGMTEARAQELWQAIEPFAGYGFNKAHAASYALVAYQTAYLKANFPVEFMTSALAAHQGNTLKVGLGVAECRRMGIDVLPPDVNESELDFGIVRGSGRERCIRFGLAAVKNVGRTAAQAIVWARVEGGPFRSLQDFCRRVELSVVSRSAIESLIKCGGFDSCVAARMGRLAMMEELDPSMGAGRFAQRAAATGQAVMFDLGEPVEEPVPSAEEATDDTPLDQRLQWERECLGIYLGPHPLMSMVGALEAAQAVPIAELVPERAGEMVRIAGLVSGQRKMTTRKDEAMMAVTIEDLGGMMEVIVFPKVLEATAQYWVDDAAVVIEGKVDYRDDIAQLLCERGTVARGLPGACDR
ncbi:MAG: DNA polymerase III subunit alpha [Chloroflexota bacterium]|nr:DNA polymerase III subunit alpha [Chloroflexota bacterium]